MRFDLVVNTFVKDALTQGRLLLHGGGRMWRPLVDVQDAADAQIACLEAPAEAVRGEIFNVVQDNYQIRDLAMLVSGAVGGVIGEETRNGKRHVVYGDPRFDYVRFIFPVSRKGNPIIDQVTVCYDMSARDFRKLALSFLLMLGKELYRDV